MTKDEIIKLAKNAGLVEWLPNSTFSDGIWWIDAHEVGSELLEFASLVAQQERKEIIAITKTHEFYRMHGEFSPSSDDLVKVIQARDNQ